MKRNIGKALGGGSSLVAIIALVVVALVPVAVYAQAKVGQPVHFVDQNGTHKAAVVVHVYPGNSALASMNVFCDLMGGDDCGDVIGPYDYKGVLVTPFIPYSATSEPVTWHYPE